MGPGNLQASNVNSVKTCQLGSGPYKKQTSSCLVSKTLTCTIRQKEYSRYREGYQYQSPVWNFGIVYLLSHSDNLMLIAK